MIAVIDYDMGNLRNVERALTRCGASIRMTTRPDEIEGASGLVLPGVGNFGDGMRNLEKSGFADAVRTWIAADKPFLGICLGMQMLMESSEEAPGVPGLGVFRGTVRRFPSGTEKIPQIGWNTVAFRESADAFRGLNGRWFYFVHSYFVAPEEDRVVAGVTRYITDFASALQRGRLIATQFHPEKSQDAGLSVLTEFVRLTEGA